MSDLGTLGGTYSYATAINNNGQILAVGSRQHDLANDREANMDNDHHSGATRAYLLTPIK